MTHATAALDDFDHRLLELLQRDATATLSDLGEAVGLSPSAVQRRLTRYRKSGLLWQVAVLDPAAVGSTLAAVWVTMERESVQRHTAFRTRMRAAAEVQQCYELAGEWDYLVIIATTGVAHCRQVVDRLFLDEGNIKRYDTHLVFDVVKHGLGLPTRDARQGKPGPRRRARAARADSGQG
ncbi:Lrp/AsnC family transcriptional regulator [Marilutibacter alkalisoli]|uniref:Lrp/AsnC family transcriptional regulator n=1 Tax=Marilutibacter alkalisoli TaxID=2591633 RepID=UPI001ABDEE9E|nr:Lrp/AsnC family transcriptional regulator [Lysobacter alkalisoli]